MKIIPKYQVRFIKAEHEGELSNLWHLSRVPCSFSGATSYDRMLWASKEFSKLHPEVSSTEAYKDLCGMLGR
jgi:hypothetical protein